MQDDDDDGGRSQVAQLDDLRSNYDGIAEHNDGHDQSLDGVLAMRSGLHDQLQVHYQQRRIVDLLRRADDLPLRMDPAIDDQAGGS